MGRKIPGRKHRGVRDPEKQQEQRLASIKDKINAPPNNPDDQQIPKSLSRIIELKNNVKNGVYNRKLKHIRKVEHSQKRLVSKTNNKPDKVIPKFEQRAGETDRDFLNRVNRICFNITKEAKFEDKYGVDIKKNEEGEVIEVVKRPKDELELLIKKAKKNQKPKKGKKKKVAEPTIKLTKSQKWQRKKLEKRKKKAALNGYDFENYSDTIKFGETVHAPPTLVVPKKSQASGGVFRPAKKEFLLQSLLSEDGNTNKSEKSNKTKEKLSEVSKKVIDKKGKRKELPHAVRRQLDKQQKQIIEAYKMLKSKKYIK